MVVIGPSATPNLSAMAEAKRISWKQADYEPSQLNDAFLVIAATDNAAVNAAVSEEANRRNQLVCCVDDPSAGNYLTAASVERGGIIIALTTSGASPTLTSIIKTRLENQFGPEWEHWAALFSTIRTSIQSLPTEHARREAVEQILNDNFIIEQVAFGELDRAEEAAKQCISSLSA